MSITVKASARKSLGEFKPLLQFSNGTTKVVEQSKERAGQNTKFGFIPGNRLARGTTYPTRDEAVAAAQAYMNSCRVEAETRLARFAAHNRPLDRVQNEIRFWSGE